jgi:hypothetical protein
MGRLRHDKYYWIKVPPFALKGKEECASLCELMTPCRQPTLHNANASCICCANFDFNLLLKNYSLGTKFLFTHISLKLFVVPLTKTLIIAWIHGCGTNQFQASNIYININILYIEFVLSKLHMSNCQETSQKACQIMSSKNALKWAI